MLRHGPLPAGFVLTLPKVTSAAQVEALAVLCERLEQAHGLPAGQLMFEIQVETPQVVLGADGAATIARCVHAAPGRWPVPPAPPPPGPGRTAAVRTPPPSRTGRTGTSPRTG